MSRPIKFRAWDKAGQRMFEVDGLSFRHQYITDEAGQHIFKFNQCVLMQFTGLHDATKWEQLIEYEKNQWLSSGKTVEEWNGKEIYEGDIVRYIRYNWKCHDHPDDHTDLTTINEIYYSDKYYAFRQRGQFKRGGGGWDGYLQFYDNRADRNEIEVIGNIYEDSHLLEKVAKEMEIYYRGMKLWTSLDILWTRGRQ